MRTDICVWWKAYFFDNPLRRLFHRPEKMLAPFVRSGMTVMDLGCGMGFFSIGMAEMVGPNGMVIAVDVQRQMLNVTSKRAERRGVSDRIRNHLAEPGKIGLNAVESIDFALAFWMVHETPDVKNFSSEVRGLLKSGAEFLVVEPRFHVTADDFAQTLNIISQAGFQKIDEPEIRLSRAALLQRQ